MVSITGLYAENSQTSMSSSELSSNKLQVYKFNCHFLEELMDFFFFLKILACLKLPSFPSPIQNVQ